jgi:HPt (histidine-containing phosphotransfer) domain-containing protein
MTTTSDAPAFDEDELLDRVESDLELLTDLVDTFADLHEPQLAALHAAQQAGDLQALMRVAHALKGALGTLAATSAKTAADLETAARNGDVDACHRGVAQIEAELPRLARDLAALVARLKA